MTGTPSSQTWIARPGTWSEHRGDTHANQVHTKRAAIRKQAGQAAFPPHRLNLAGQITENYLLDLFAFLPGLSVAYPQPGATTSSWMPSPSLNSMTSCAWPGAAPWMITGIWIVTVPRASSPAALTGRSPGGASHSSAPKWIPDTRTPRTVSVTSNRPAQPGRTQEAIVQVIGVLPRSSDYVPGRVIGSTRASCQRGQFRLNCRAPRLDAPTQYKLETFGSAADGRRVRSGDLADE